MEYNYNKCPECGYSNNFPPDVCPVCGFDWASYRKELHRKQEEEEQLAQLKEDYAQAIGLFNDGFYQEAQTAFMVLGDYKESAAFVEKCKESLLKQVEAERLAEQEECYTREIELFNEGRYKDALENFMALGDCGYKDSTEFVEKCKETIYQYLVDGFNRNLFLNNLMTREKCFEDFRDPFVQECRQKYKVRDFKKVKKSFNGYEGYKQTRDYMDCCDRAIELFSLYSKQETDYKISTLEPLDIGDYDDLSQVSRHNPECKDALERSGDAQIESDQIKQEQENKCKDEKVNGIKCSKEKHRAIIGIIVLVAMILGIILPVRGCAAKYSVDNIDIAVVEKYNYSGQYNKVRFTLVFEVENKGSLDIHQLIGDLNIYNSSGESLLSDTLTLNGVVKPDNILQFEVDLNLSATSKSTELYETGLSGLKITLCLTEVTFERNNKKEYKNDKEKILSAIGAGD